MSETTYNFIVSIIGIISIFLNILNEFLAHTNRTKSNSIGQIIIHKIKKNKNKKTQTTPPPTPELETNLEEIVINNAI